MIKVRKKAYHHNWAMQYTADTLDDFLLYLEGSNKVEVNEIGTIYVHEYDGYDRYTDGYAIHLGYWLVVLDNGSYQVYTDTVFKERYDIV